MTQQEWKRKRRREWSFIQLLKVESGVSPRGPGSQKTESVLGRSPSDRSSSGQYWQGYSRLRRTERGRFVYAESEGGLKSAKGLHCTSVITTFHLELGWAGLQLRAHFKMG